VGASLFIAPITIVEPFAVGGPLDTIGRIIAERIQVSLDQPVIIENVPGASGTLGIGRVARATPDGYTISHGSTPTHVFSGAIFKLPFNVENDFQPISPIASGPLLIVAKKAVAANDLKEFIAWLKADPGKAAQATGGVAATSHIAGVFFQQISGTPKSQPRRFLWSVGMASAWVEDLIYNSYRLSQ
jgi:tripartite-type tricarboxylate transporter receptor subunit TctC